MMWSNNVLFVRCSRTFATTFTKAKVLKATHLDKMMAELAGFFYYFAFGSNLLDERIHVQIKDAEFETVAYLKNYELTFFDNGSRWKGAVASIEPKNGSEVWGCVWKVPNNFSEELDLQETGYHQLQVSVHSISDSNTIDCRTYQYSSENRRRQSPSPHYKAVILAGAIEHQFPGWYIDQLRNIKDNGYQGKVELDLDAIKHLNQDGGTLIDTTTTSKVTNESDADTVPRF